MSLRTFAKKALPWLAFALAIVALGYTWKWAVAKSSARHQLHQTFSTGTTKYIFGLCPSTPLVDDVPRWASDMRGLCQARQPTWGSLEHGTPRPELDIEKDSTWESLQLLSRLVLEISPGKLLSLLSLVVISLAGVLGLQQQGWLGQGTGPRLRVARGAALSMLTIVMLALSASLVLLDEQETLSMCQVTGSTYANLLSIDARCSQQTMLLRDTQALLEQKKGELDSRARELEDLKQEIASLGAMRDALGTFKTELKSQSESTQQLIMAVTGATLESIGKAVDPLHKDVKGLDESVDALQGDLKSLVQGELKVALQSEELKDVIRREVRAAVREEVRGVVRGELQESLKPVLAAARGATNASFSVPARPTVPEVKKPTVPEVKKPTVPEIKKPKAPTQGKH